MSPRELARELEAANARQQDAVEGQIFLAWQTAQFAALAVHGKLPPLKQVLAKVTTSKRGQTKAEFAAMVYTLAAQSGFPVRRMES